MAMESGHHLDVEALEHICFQRSKKWGNLFEDISHRDDGKELHVNEFEDIFDRNEGDDDDGDGDGSDVDFVENDDVLEEITNRRNDLHKTRVDGNQKPKHKYDLPLVKAYDSRIDEDLDRTEMEHVVDETLPILVEHKRKWEENGLERVLQSFDTDKIERKVGSWLRRNNSGFSQNNKTVVYNAPSHSHSKESMTSRVPQLCKHNHKKDEIRHTYSSDEGSMHSVDTARYIKSSRRHVEPQNSFSSFCTKTTIKTYRMVKSKRDELREKYGCPEYDEEHSHRIQKMRHRHQQNHRQHDTKCQRKYPLDGYPMSLSQRRKHLIKRGSNLNMTVSSSDDEECEEYMVVCNRTNRPKMKSTRCCPSVQRTRHRCDRTCTRSSKHYNEQYVERDLFFEDDRRPYKREIDCSCCNETKLCKSVLHLANSSTEDWLVENGDSDESIKLSSKLDYRKALKEKEKLNRKDKKRGTVGGGNGKRHVTNISETNKSAIKTTRSKHYLKTSRSLRERKTKKNYVVDSLSDSDDNYTPVKKKPITKTTKDEIHSKMTHPPAASENEMRSARKQPTILDKTKEKQVMMPDKVAARQQKEIKKSTNDENDENLNNESLVSDSFVENLQRAITISKKTYKEEMKRSLKDKEKKESCKKPKQQKDVSQKSLMLMEATITDGGESTFFSSKHDICNSTELNNKPFKMELNGGSMTKHEAAISTTHHLVGKGVGGGGNSANSSKAAKRAMKLSETIRKIITLDDNDCTIVSSTTDADVVSQQLQQNATKLVPPPQPPTPIEQQQSLPPITDKGILLYAPNARDVAPTNSFHNGYFIITEEHLSSIIGKDAAQKFLKYYIGRRCFQPNSTIYFKPPPKTLAYRAAESSTTLGGGPSQASKCDGSDSDDDEFAKIGRYGHIYESFEK